MKKGTHIICPECGAAIPASPELAASLMGRAGTGAAKRRDIDYAALASRSHEARRRNKAAREAAGESTPPQAAT